MDNNVEDSKKENKYQINKTIRFKLKPQYCVDKTLLKDRNKNRTTLDNPNGDNSFSNLIEQLSDLNKSLKDLLCVKETAYKYIWCCGLSIKYTWMRNYMKTAFYENKKDNAPKQYKLKDLGYVQQEFKDRFFCEIDEIIEKLNDFEKRNQANQYEKQRYSQAALILNQLSKRSNFDFIKSFIYSLTSTNKPNIDEKINDLKKLITDKIEPELDRYKKFYSPYQSNGLQVAAGSFNYYTINKFPKLLIQEEKKLEQDLKKSIFKTEFHNGKQICKLEETYSCYSNIIKELNLKEELQNKSLDEIYHFLKIWKANQKKEFMEAIQAKNNKKSQSIKLFKSSDKDFNTIKECILSLQEISSKLNNDSIPSKEKDTLREKLKNLKCKKKDFFNTFTKNSQTPNYKSLCEFYKKIALKRGEIIAKLSAIEKEKISAEQLQYWSLIVEKEKRKYLYMIPRDENDTLKKAKKYIENLKRNTNTDTTTTLSYFNSLTLNALRKLCFKDTNNTFKESVSNKVNFPKYEQEWNQKKDGEKKKIEFYQNVLKNATSLNLSEYSGIKALYNNSFESLDDFERELNKVCYVKTICTPEDEDIETKLKENFKALCFEITSQDIEHYLNKEINNSSDSYKSKALTKIWFDFWDSKNTKNKYPIRLNPEVKILWRDAKPSRVHKYGKDSSFYDSTKKNRYLNPQYTLVTTITQNAHDIKINFAFNNTRDKGEAILEFNKKVNEQEIDYSLGIDVGTDDLALLTLINKGCIPQSFTAYRIKDDKLNFSKKGYFKDGTEREKPYELIKNPSYFLNEDLYKKTFKTDDFEEIFNELFEKKSVSSIDLTIAKVISGKIILNGDFSSHQTLKILNAKRKISQELKLNPTLSIDTCSKDEYKLCLKNKVGKETKIYDSKLLYEYVRPYKEVKTEIFDFFKNQKLDNARLEDNINKTRNSLVANMVGVIAYLYEKFPCFIILENLTQSIIESHRQKFEGDITRPLEWALYRRFQSTGLVPPISELIKLREVEKFSNSDSKQKKHETIHQFGIIKFVSEKETSLTCPSCSEKAYDSNDQKYNDDKRQGVFDCEECNFHNKTNPGSFSSLDTNDKIAAFNIAKRGF